jgi:hypothetical protein
MDTVNEKKNGLKQRILHELIKYWLIVLCMAIFFGAFSSYRRLLLAHYGISYEDYGISVIRALVLAKVVLVAETFRLGRGYEEKPLVVPTLYKTFLFTLCVAVYDIAEGLVRGLIGGLGPMGALDEVTSRFNYELLSRALVIFLAFIPLFAVRELRRVLGEGVTDIFFRRRQAEQQLEARSQIEGGVLPPGSSSKMG